ncbi:craniofacial development protein 2-like [Penaeus chinensis]|uniref:craniofacial development protein 2-like n=1 Tax=Penaeus chinensis TaxID=139456 RepID=UPI001FB7461E|nr:craniofacial development protein 2-like [Penaeus chinensis]
MESLSSAATLCYESICTRTRTAYRGWRVPFFMRLKQQDIKKEMKEIKVYISQRCHMERRGPEKRREPGVGLIVKLSLVGKLVGLPKGVNDRFMTMRLPLSHGQKFATIINAYVSTMTNPDEVKDKFYEDLNTVIAAVPNADKLIILGDFNARVGRDSTIWEGVIGKYGVGSIAEYNLITNTIFRLPTRNRTPAI